MKKAGISILMAGMATIASATIIAGDDFSGGTLGNQLNGMSVQIGTGMWTKSYSAGYSGNMSPLVYSSGGVGAGTGATGGNGAIAGDYSAYTNILKVSTVFSVGSSKTNNVSVSVGFYETINKGLLQNVSIDDVVACRLLTGGANEGKIVWNIRDDGVLRNKTFEGGLVTFASNDVIRLTISYNLQTGEAAAEAYNVTQGSVINTGTVSAAGIDGFNYAGIGASGVVTEAADPFCFERMQVEAIPELGTLGLLGFI